MSYKLGPVKPWVRAAANEIGPVFGITKIHGYGKRPNPTDHDDGLALDFMTRDGAGLSRYARMSARDLGVTYVIWDQHIWSVQRNGEGWRKMPDRGSDTANHKDHVHVSFTASPPPGFTGGGDAPSTPYTPDPAAIGKPSPTNPWFPSADALPDELVEGAQRVAVYAAAIGLGGLLILVGVAATANRGRKNVTSELTDTVKGTLT